MRSPGSKTPQVEVSTRNAQPDGIFAILHWERRNEMYSMKGSYFPFCARNQDRARTARRSAKRSVAGAAIRGERSMWNRIRGSARRLVQQGYVLDREFAGDSEGSRSRMGISLYGRDVKIGIRKGMIQCQK